MGWLEMGWVGNAERWGYLNQGWVKELRMIGKFIDFIRVAWVAHSIEAAHSGGSNNAINDVIQYYKRPGALERVLFDELKSNAGVFVHWGVYGSGKTFAQRKAAILLRNAGRLVISTDGYHVLWEERRSLKTFLRRAIGIPTDLLEPISNFLTRPTTVIIDDMDVVLRRAVDYRGYIKDLLNESRENPKFNVLLMVTSWEWCAELRNLGCTVVGSPSRWTRDDLMGLYNNIPDSMREKNDHEEVLTTSAIAGTPGELTFFATGKPMARHALTIKNEWRKGVKALDGLDVPEASSFPGKDGIFHWDELK
jgi:hypothetical protein